MTGCLKPAKIESLYSLNEIASPQIRGDVAADTKRTKARADHRHPMYNITSAKFRLKLKKNFLKTSRVIEGETDQERTKRWRQNTNETNQMKR